MDYSKVTNLKARDFLGTYFADQELIDMLADEEICQKMIKVPWSDQPANAVDMLWSLDRHEVLHTGWNIALMDHLSIKRFSALKKLWG